jgi:hypothetical protein
VNTSGKNRSLQLVEEPRFEFLNIVAKSNLRPGVTKVNHTLHFIAGNAWYALNSCMNDMGFLVTRQTPSICLPEACSWRTARFPVTACDHCFVLSDIDRSCLKNQRPMARFEVHSPLKGQSIVSAAPEQFHGYCSSAHCTECDHNKLCDDSRLRHQLLIRYGWHVDITNVDCFGPIEVKWQSGAQYWGYVSRWSNASEPQIDP